MDPTIRTDPPYVRIGTRTCEYASSSVLPSWSSFLARPPSHVSCPLASSPSPLSPLAQFQPSRPLLLFPLSSFPFLRFRRVLLAHLPFPAAAPVLPSPATPPRSSRPGLTYAGHQPSSPRALLGCSRCPCEVQEWIWRIFSTGPSRSASSSSGASPSTSWASTRAIGGARASCLTTSTT